MSIISVFVSSESLGGQQAVLSQLCVSDQSVSGDVDLVSMLYWPLQQLHQYNRVLLKMAVCFDVVRTKHPLHASSLFCACLHFYSRTLFSVLLTLSFF